MDPLTSALMGLAQFLGYKPGALGMAAAGPAVPGTTPGPSQPGGPGTTGSFDISKLLNLIMLASGGYMGTDYLREIQRLYNEQRAAAAMMMNPAAMSKRLGAFMQQIPRQLAYNVTSAADAATGGRGMAEAPGAVAAGRAAALAPYATQEQQMAEQLAMAGPEYMMKLKAPDYMGVLDELGQLGQNETLPAFLRS